MTDDVTASSTDDVLAMRIRRAALVTDVQHYRFYSGSTGLVATIVLALGVARTPQGVEPSLVLLVPGGLALVVMLFCMVDLSRSSDELGRVTRKLLVLEREEELRYRESSIDG